MLSYDEWFEKHGFEIEDENSFDAYEDYISDYQDREYDRWKDDKIMGND